MPDNQVVTAEDARNLAEALVRGLARLKDPQDRALVRQMVCLCRAGRFVIG